MTREQAIEMAKAKLKCIECQTCNHDYNCDECSLNYEQGNMGEQKE